MARYCHEDGEFIFQGTPYEMACALREARAAVERLRVRLRDQTLQTQETAQQIHNRVVDVLERYDVVPDGLDVQGHPIEQVVGTCLATVQLKAAEAAGEE